MGAKPLYVVKLNHETVNGQNVAYYDPEAYFSGVPREKAKKMTHKEARGVSDYLRSIRQGYHCEVEPV
jgi:hypothetical protein